MADVDRPLSPHLQVWRWGIHMFMSIMHRVTGSANVVGALIIVWGVYAIAAGPDAYENFRAVLGSVLGRLVLFGLTVSFMWHLCSGVRHLMMDAGYLLDLGANKASARIALVAALLISVALWVFGYMSAGAI